MSDVLPFSKRSGFALLVDLEDPTLGQLRELCEQSNEDFSGTSALDWSRQWEYPWVLAQLPTEGGGRRVLDAGCGYRFFTALLAQRGFDVEACDRDASIGPRLDEVAARDELPIDFTAQDLTKLNYSDARFDHICCVSVLEHTRDPAAIVAEFRRCLKPGGTLLLTFDVSVTGERDIPLDRARELVATLESQFELGSPFFHRDWLEGDALAHADDALRTSWFRKHRPERLPWRFVSRAYLQGLARGRLRRPFFDLAVVGLALRRPLEGP